MRLHGNLGLLGLGFPFLVSDTLIKVFSANGIYANILFYIFYGLSLLASALFVWLFLRRQQVEEAGGASKAVAFLRDRRKFFAITSACSVLLFAALLIFALTDVSPSKPLLAAAAFLAGVGIASNYQQWFSLYAKRSREVAITLMLVTFSLSALLRLGISFLSPLTSVVLMALLVPIAQLLNYRAVRRSEGESATVSGLVIAVPEQDFNRPVIFVVCLVAYSGVLAILRGANFDSQFIFGPNQLNLLLRAVFPVVMLLLIVYFKRLFGLVQLSQIALLCLVSTVLVVRYTTQDSTLWTVALAAFVRSVVVIFVYLSLVLIMLNGKRHPVVTFGIGWGAYIFAAGAGLIISSFLSNAQLQSDVALSLVYVLILATLLPLILSSRRVRPVASRVSAEEERDATMVEELWDVSLEEGQGWTLEQEQSLALERRLCELKQDYALTDREIELMRHLRTGHTKRRIAEEMHVSENTVRNYAKSLYVKLGVHNKEQVLDCIGL